LPTASAIACTTASRSDTTRELSLLAVPNVSEGRDAAALDAIAQAFGPGLVHRSADPDHHRSVFTIRGRPGELAERVLAGAREAVARIDLRAHQGVHPRVGAVDVAPIVYLEPAQRGAAVAEALVLADRLAHELRLPVFLYGALAGGRTRAELRRGGPEALQRRIESGELAPDAGPRRLHPTAGAVLVAARPPLAAFNLELAAPLETARRIAAAIREGGAEGLPGVRALGLHLPRQGIVQVSTNIEDLTRATPADVVRAVQRHATVTGAELIAPAPENAFAGFPADIPLRGAPLL
jgi:glutamate formiminotransferase / 5-formyltetrahydrofolate cyclo-ligase